jgi:hypothetical protein
MESNAQNQSHDLPGRSRAALSIRFADDVLLLRALVLAASITLRDRGSAVTDSVDRHVLD